MGFAIMPTVAKVTVRAPPNVVHVGRSSQGPLLMTPRKSPRGPCQVHFFFFWIFKSWIYRLEETSQNPRCPPWSSWLGTGLPCGRLEFKSLQCHCFFLKKWFWFFFLVHEETGVCKMPTRGPRVMSTRGRRWGPCARSMEICFTNVHFWQCPRVDIVFRQGGCNHNCATLPFVKTLWRYMGWAWGATFGRVVRLIIG